MRSSVQNVAAVPAKQQSRSQPDALGPAQVSHASKAAESRLWAVPHLTIPLIQSAGVPSLQTRLHAKLHTALGPAAVGTSPKASRKQWLHPAKAASPTVQIPAGFLLQGIGLQENLQLAVLKCHHEPTGRKGRFCESYQEGSIAGSPSSERTF